MGVVAFAQIPASAKLELPPLPLPTASPLKLEDLLNLDELLKDPPASVDIGQIVEGTTSTVSDLLGDTPGAPDGEPGGGRRPPAPEPAPSAPVTDSWSTDRVLVPAGSTIPATRVAGHKLGSYTGAVGNGFSRAARRAAALAGPVAAPMILALFAVGLLFVAARGPGRLVKVEEERTAFRERRTFRL